MSIAPEIVELESQIAIAVRGDLPIAELPQFFEHAFTTAAAAIEANCVEIAGPPFGFYPSMPTETVAVEAGFPVTAVIEPEGEAHSLVLPGGQAVVLIHTGPFETLRETYAELQAWMDEQKVQPATGMWECYLTDPVTEPDPARWQTKIVWPIV